MTLVVVHRIQNSLAFGNEGVARVTQLKTILVKLFLGSFKDFAIVKSLIKHPPGTEFLEIILLKTFDNIKKTYDAMYHLFLKTTII